MRIFTMIFISIYMEMNLLLMTKNIIKIKIIFKMTLIEIYHKKSYETWNEFLNEFNEYTKQSQSLFTIYESKKSKSDDQNHYTIIAIINV